MVSIDRADASHGERCVFPPLHQTPGGCEQWASAEAPQAVAAHIAQIGAESKQQENFVLGALWSVILRRYVECPVTELWMNSPGQQGSWAPPEPMTVDIKDNMQLRKVLKASSWSPIKFDNRGPPNTGVIVADAQSCTSNELIEEHLQASEVRQPEIHSLN